MPRWLPRTEAAGYRGSPTWEASPELPRFANEGTGLREVELLAGDHIGPGQPNPKAPKSCGLGQCPPNLSPLALGCTSGLQAPHRRVPHRHLSAPLPITSLCLCALVLAVSSPGFWAHASPKDWLDGPLHEGLWGSSYNFTTSVAVCFWNLRT